MRGLAVVGFLSLVVGCAGKGAVGPHRIAHGGETFHARLTPKSEVRNWMLFTGAPYRELRFTDEVSGEHKTIVSWTSPVPYALTPLDEATYQSEVSAARARWSKLWAEQQQARRDAEARQQKQWELEDRVRQKDWQRWYESFLADGYEPDEAAYKANRIMRGR